jgi:hypothetical protein
MFGKGIEGDIWRGSESEMTVILLSQMQVLYICTITMETRLILESIK